MIKLRYCCLIIFLFAFNLKLIGAEIPIYNSTQRISIGKYIDILQTGEEVSFREVLKSSAFKRYNNDVPNIGLINHSVWFKFTVRNFSEINHLLLEIAYPILDQVELFIPIQNGQYKKVIISESSNFNARKYQHPNYIFDLNIPSSTSLTYYLKVKSAEQIILPITINTPTTLWERLTKDSLITGIYTGIVLIMFLYNLFLFFSVKDKSYLFYVIYVAFVGLTQIGIKGYTFQYLWPELSEFQLKSTILFACVSGFAALLFTQNFLQTKKNANKFHYALSVLLVLFIIGFVITFAGWIQLGFQLMQGVTSLLTIFVLSVSYIIMSKGFGPAKFFFTAWSVLLVGAIIFLLKDYGILPYNNLTSYSMQAASAIEMALLSFGLADRINILKKEKEESQAAALYAAQENERIIREQNVLLEAKVQERTMELIDANDELSKTLVELKDAQTQLVESEKMSSLGQLTAGIAHEINNPINFVTSNVAPLRRDVDMLLESASLFENIGLSETPIDEKKKQIEEHKEEIDFEYLKEEINHLLNGIHEGASRTAEIVKGLRIFSRVDEDDLKKADINEGLDSTLVIINNLLDNKIKVTKNYGNLPLIECFPGKLNQVFLNIITNAIHAIKQRYGSEPSGKLEIATSFDENNVYVKIMDNGTGMSEQVMKKIFEPFFTTKEVGEGTGLGMSITYNTIKKHNGEIHVRSAVGVGTEFTLELPISHNTAPVDEKLE